MCGSVGTMGSEWSAQIKGRDNRWRTILLFVNSIFGDKMSEFEKMRRKALGIVRKK